MIRYSTTTLVCTWQTTIIDANYAARYHEMVTALQPLVDSGLVQSGESRDLELKGRSLATVELLEPYLWSGGIQGQHKTLPGL
ncbi:MAG: hypothetical protein ABSG90_03470 [Dehalococcoidia bacterium]